MVKAAARTGRCAGAVVRAAVPSYLSPRNLSERMMPNMTIVALYTGLNGLILFWLALAVSRVRMRSHVWVGDGGVSELVLAMRGQANFAEYVPLCLVILVAMAGLGAPAYVLQLFGLALTLGRVAHAAHFTGLAPSIVFRPVSYTHLTLPTILLV